jgi:hypothetical protein
VTPYRHAICFFVAIEIITMKLLHGGNMVNYHNNCVL